MDLSKTASEQLGETVLDRDFVGWAFDELVGKLLTFMESIGYSAVSNTPTSVVDQSFAVQKMIKTLVRETQSKINKRVAIPTPKSITKT